MSSSKSRTVRDGGKRCYSSIVASLCHRPEKLAPVDAHVYLFTQVYFLQIGGPVSFLNTRMFRRATSKTNPTRLLLFAECDIPRFYTRTKTRRTTPRKVRMKTRRTTIPRKARRTTRRRSVYGGLSLRFSPVESGMRVPGSCNRRPEVWKNVPSTCRHAGQELGAAAAAAASQHAPRSPVCPLFFFPC